jgi:hypothetical protein
MVINGKIVMIQKKLVMVHLQATSAITKKNLHQKSGQDMQCLAKYLIQIPPNHDIHYTMMLNEKFILNSS